MDTERGNIIIVFKKIPYKYITEEYKTLKNGYAYQNVDKYLYMFYSSDVFSCATDDERKNKYAYMCEQIQNFPEKASGVFSLVFDAAESMLRLDGNEIECKFDQILRWREISLQLGQDFFTCAYLARYDLQRGRKTRTFTWLPIIRSDNNRLHNILAKGIAENHFHLNGSTKIFELNWLCLMNHIAGRQNDFNKIEKTLQQYRADKFHDPQKGEKFYTECQRAALYRLYLFAVLKQNNFLEDKIKKLLDRSKNEIWLNSVISVLQDLIILTGNLFGARLEGNILDYALEKDMIHENHNECRLLAGERRFLYNCYQWILADCFNDQQKNYFYAYLSIRTDFRGELIQINQKTGFSNFSDYQDRKEYFIEGHKSYEKELVRLALNESLRKPNMLSLEARICPKKKSSLLYGSLKRYENIVKEDLSDELYEKLIYVLHFPKSFETHFVEGTPRNNDVRKKSVRQARCIAALLERNKDINRKIRGIDACSSEIACRPEVFGQIFRYLSDIPVIFERNYDGKILQENNSHNLHKTYHAGEDFLDIADGLRAIDEAILFCNMERGSRLGHALALGIDPEKYYEFKGYKISLSRQILLDDIVWMYCKAGELGCHIEENLKTELHEKYVQLFKSIFDDTVTNNNFSCPSMYEYYQSWKLRGDKPDSYLLKSEEFIVNLTRTELKKFDRYQFNSWVSNDIRKVDKYRKLYKAYHYNAKVRRNGDKITEFKIKKDYVILIRQLQDKMIQELVCKGIGIETNPSSNYLIGTIKKYEEHPILRFNSRKLKHPETEYALNISINTDDQGVFDTLLENEYALMTLALKKATNEELKPLYHIEDIYEWIDYVRNMGIDQIFS